MNKKTKRIMIRVISYSAAAVAVMAVLFAQATTKMNTLKDKGECATNIVYQRAFSELVSSVEDINHSLEKSMYVSSPSLSVSVYSELYSESREAAACLGMLPFSSAELEKTSAFISKVGDYCYSLSKKASSGESITPEEAENLKSLSQSAAGLSSQLVDLQSKVFSDGLKIESLALDESKTEGADTNTVQVIENDFMESPSLVYDGPFSEHIESMEPLFLKDKQQVTPEEAQKKAETFFGLKNGVISKQGEVNGKLPAYIFAGKDDSGEIYIQVTKAGGEMLYMNRAAYPQSSGLSREGAMDRAKQFLDENGVSEMKDTYSQQYNNSIIFNFAFSDNGVLCYSDLVKVTIALDSGNIVGYEAKGYIMSHTTREIPQAAVSADQAMAEISGDLTVLTTQLCFIPTAGKNEIFCQELKCENADGKHYLLYVNAQTGAEEKILILLEDENGTLSV